VVPFKGVDIPVDGRELLCQLALCDNLALLLAVDILVDAPSFFERRDTTAHPGSAAGKLVIRGEYRPVESLIQGNQAIHGADGLALEE
jgi:hypothetical protein